MAKRRSRRTPSLSSSFLRDVTHIANRVPWYAAAALGLVLFVTLYWFAPPWLEGKLAQLPEDNQFRPLAEALVGRRLHWLPRFGIALGLICAFFAVKNFFSRKTFGREGERNVGFFARLGARWLD